MIGDEDGSEFAVANAGAGNLNDMSVYGVADVRKAIEDRNKLAMEQQRRYDAQVEEIKARRAGPSFSERMFQLSAALATPTEQRGLGGILANVTPVLAAQQKAKRQGELTRREALEELEAKRLTQQMGLANQDVTTQLALANLAKKGSGPGQWSERFGQFIPKDRVVPVSSAVHKTGRRLVTYSDGSSKLYGLNGNPKAFEILDGALTVIGQGTE
jgi:hypothetical protein